MNRCIKCGEFTIFNNFDLKCDSCISGGIYINKEIIEASNAAFRNRIECPILDETPEEDFSDMNDFATPESFK